MSHAATDPAVKPTTEPGLDAIVSHLERLVSFDSQNPPREIDGEHPMFGYLTSKLQGFDIDITDHGDGHVSYLARRGRPRLLFNVHLDTVPVGEGWSTDPLELVVKDGRAYGRGSCDIKGAAACLLDLAETTDVPLALLFTSDEEGSGGCCVKRFCEGLNPGEYELVVVAEPTSCRVVTAHRGYLSVIGKFTGVAGHSSDLRGVKDNALHDFARWAGAAVELVEREHPDSRFNLGRVDGGIKSNVIADNVHVAYSARLAPGSNSDEFLKVSTSAGADLLSRQPTWEVPFLGPPLPAPGVDPAPAIAFAESIGLPLGEAVGFWTESSLFSAAGLQTFVLGPGDIALAHAIDEWVPLADLATARAQYEQLARNHD
ncbi:MAG: acetylornithine deacetylase [Pseudomonadota bacterium]